METEGGGPDPPKEGTRPPDEERTRPTIEVESESAAGEKASSGGSPGGSQNASYDGGSGQELPDVSRGNLPSTTISTNNQESTEEDRGGPASKEIPADLPRTTVRSALPLPCPNAMLASRVQVADPSKARKRSQGLRRPCHWTVTAPPGIPGTPLLWRPKARIQARMTS
jgi:hypothetical protein